MSEADKMFEKMGYKTRKDEEIIWFQKKLNETTFIDILFDLQKKNVSYEKLFYNKKGSLLKKESIINLQELQAINKKCKELRWLDE